MIARRKRFGALVIPLFALTLGLTTYLRLTGTENIRAIHIATLIAIGMALGVFLRNVLTYFSKTDRSV